MTTTPDDIIEFWFGDNSPAVYQRWFTRDAAFDAEITRRFGDVHARATRGELDSWRGTARGELALIIVLDQFSRNMFRDDPRAFANDEKAVEIEYELLGSGRADELTDLQQLVAALPLMHAESADAQAESIGQYESLQRGNHDNPLFNNSLEYARKHAEIIERFGRFPHRNAALGRKSTKQELEFLKEPGSSF